MLGKMAIAAAFTGSPSSLNEPHNFKSSQIGKITTPGANNRRME